MKRFCAVVLICFAALLSAEQLNAQKYGISGGATFSSLSGIEGSSNTGWNVGATVQFKLPLGFSIQPSLMYNTKVSQVGSSTDAVDWNAEYLELPVSFQWGPDLLLFRPFVDASPYIGYALETSRDMEQFEYGLALGGGIEVWRLQVTCRYNWNFGPLVGSTALKDLTGANALLKDSNFRGVTLSVALLFGN